MLDSQPLHKMVLHSQQLYNKCFRICSYTRWHYIVTLCYMMVLHDASPGYFAGGLYSMCQVMTGILYNYILPYRNICTRHFLVSTNLNEMKSLWIVSFETHIWNSILWMWVLPNGITWCMQRMFTISFLTYLLPYYKLAAGMEMLSLVMDSLGTQC